MLIVDSQVHIWAADTLERPWPPIKDPTQSRAHRPEPITKDDMLREMAAAGVDRAVIAPPVWEGVRNDIALAAARAHPDKFAVMGRVDLNNPASRDLLLALAKRPNISVKASCMPLYTADAYPYRRLHPWLRRVYDAFGPQRMFWGSDLSRLECSYRESVTMFTEEMPWLSAADLDWIMGRGLCAWIGWKV